MGQSDLEVLLDMGFERARAELAVKKTGGCQSTLAADLLLSREANTASSAKRLELAGGDAGYPPGGAASRRNGS